MPPLVSVIVPCSNSEFLKECVDSVLSQTFENLEVIVVDSSGDQEALALAKATDDPRLHLFQRREPHFPGENRNFGIERAAADFILCLDADDLIEETFVEEALFVICCSDYSLVGTSVRAFGTWKGRPVDATVKFVAHPTIDQLADGDEFVVTMLMRKKLWQTIGGFKDEGLGSQHMPEDWDFFLRALASGHTLYNRGTYGFHYRKHPVSVTAQLDFGQMKERIQSRHAEVLAKLKSTKQPDAIITKDGWRRMLPVPRRKKTTLLILPEIVNDRFIDRLSGALESISGSLTVLSTCQMETYSQDFIALLQQRHAELFSFPDFLEQQELWLEFVRYLAEAREITQVLYGQNPFFLDNLPALKQLFPSHALTYLSRYATETVRP